MRRGLYPKLAWEGMRKNRRLYLPYIFTGCMMVMMYYILRFLSESPAVMRMEGGSTLSAILPLGSWIIAAFSALFIFYTNSFLIKQRYREFGLYNILGMDKTNLSVILWWESLFVAAFAVAGGLAAGIVLSKAAELVLVNLMGMAVTYTLAVGVTSLWQTAAVFGGIYLLILVNSLIRVRLSGPLSLVKSGKVGERVPRLTWLLAVAGVVLLSLAYYLAVSITDPLTATVWFFVAVLLVIAGTYLLFIAGSVVFCRLLQKNKGYYYKRNHFVSVSSMVYRMKRNGAGLASICILLTMVLVMISSTASLYFGEEDILRARCPNHVNLYLVFDDYSGIGEANLNSIRRTVSSHSGEAASLEGVRTCEVYGLIQEEGIRIDLAKADAEGNLYGQTGYLSVMPLSDYNAGMGTDYTLEEGECLLYAERMDYTAATFTMEYGAAYRIKERLPGFTDYGRTVGMTVPVIYMVVEDLDAFVAPVKDKTNSVGDPLMTYDWRCGFDLSDESSERAVRSAVDEALLAAVSADENGMYVRSLDVISREEKRSDFYAMYGSLFFLGIMLSVVFLMAAVLIIYYKQISEGYEDAARFDIMKKVGMTGRDIRKSINSQMLTVFFLPLAFAGVHLSFSFPFTSKILMIFAFDNRLLNITVSAACFAAFGILYAVVYKITSGAYYAIVSGRRDS